MSKSFPWPMYPYSHGHGEDLHDYLMRMPIGNDQPPDSDPTYDPTAEEIALVESLGLDVDFPWKVLWGMSRAKGLQPDELHAMPVSGILAVFAKELTNAPPIGSASPIKTRRTRRRTNRPLTRTQQNIAATVMRHEGNTTAAAAELGITRQAVEKINKAALAKLAALGQPNTEKPIAMDPTKLEAGKNPSGRTKRQRPKMDDNDD